MSQSQLNDFKLKLDDWRVRQHFKHVDMVLRAADVRHLPPSVRQSREEQVKRLQAYAARGVFPRNHERSGFAPCFIDRDGRECAVAHLVMNSGHAALAYKIAGVDNCAYVQAMKFPELNDWAAQTGLSKQELALIQPGYYDTFSGSLLSLAIAAWATGLMAFAVNAVQIVRRRYELFTPAVGIALAVVLLFVAFKCLSNAATAYSFGISPDGFPYDLPLRDVPPLCVGGLVSLGIALLVGGTSIYRLRRRDFMRAEVTSGEQSVEG